MAYIMCENTLPWANAPEREKVCDNTLAWAAIVAKRTSQNKLRDERKRKRKRRLAHKSRTR